MVRSKASRFALAVACAALAACVVNLSFDMDQSNLALMADVPGSISQNALVDLGNYADIRAHKSDIRSLDLDYADVTITALNPGNQATTLNATVSLRKNYYDSPDQDLLVGNLQAFVVQKNGTRRLQGNPQIDAFLLDRLHDGGKFYLLVNGATDAKTDIVLDVNLHASMAYDTGLF
jgi:hypothetical protein